MQINFPPVAVATRYKFCIGFACSMTVVALTICAGTCVPRKPWPFYRTWAWARKPWPNGKHFLVMRSTKST